MTQGLEEVRRIAQEHGNDLALVVNHSGGKDSTRMLGFVRKKFPDAPTYAVMADTGFEHVSPISAADFARARCAEFGLDFTVVRNAKRTYLGILNCIGIRSEESNSRSRLSPLTRNEALSTGGERSTTGSRSSTEPSLMYSPGTGVNAIRLHPVYVPEYHKDGTTGSYLPRFSCRVCIFSTDADLAAIHQHDRDAFNAVSSLERKLKFTMRPGASLVEIAEAHFSKRAEEARQQSFCF